VSSTGAPHRTGHARKRAHQSLRLVLAVVFLVAGGLVLLGLPRIVESFARWGYPAWAALVVGLAQIAGAVMLLVPHRAPLGAAGLGVIMTGAVTTHLLHGEFLASLVPLALLVVLGVITFRPTHPPRHR
jgi:putative oxidoreductase